MLVSMGFDYMVFPQNREPVGLQVSIVCLTYNHRDYIEQCLDSLLMQVTTFPYEIVIHDDASNDGTAEVIRRYAELYPDTINAILQEENLYSRGLSISDEIVPHLRGKYVAFCEGDDWWLSPDKLQIQYEYMEANPDCTLCAHDVVPFCELTQRYGKIFPRFNKAVDLTTEYIVEHGGGVLGTNSFFFRAEDYSLPDPYLGWGIGDYPRMIYLSIKGRVHVLPYTYSAYRVLAKGSWTQRSIENPRVFALQRGRVIEGLQLLDNATNGAYQVSIDNAVQSLRLAILEKSRDWRGVKEEGLDKWLRARGLKAYLKSWVKSHLPERSSSLFRYLLLVFRYHRRGFSA